MLCIIAHYYSSLLFRYCVQLLRFCPINIIHKISNPSSNFRNLRLWSVPIDIPDSHHSSRLCGYLVFRIKWVNSSFGDPLFRIDISIIQFKIWSLSRLILFEYTWLSPFYALSSYVLRTPFDVSKWPVNVGLYFLHIADIQLVMNESFWLHYLWRWLQ